MMILGKRKIYFQRKVESNPKSCSIAAKMVESPGYDHVLTIYKV